MKRAKLSPEMRAAWEDQQYARFDQLDSCRPWRMTLRSMALPRYRDARTAAGRIHQGNRRFDAIRDHGRRAVR